MYRENIGTGLVPAASGHCTSIAREQKKKNINDGHSKNHLPSCVLSWLSLCSFFNAVPTYFTSPLGIGKTLYIFLKGAGVEASCLPSPLGVLTHIYPLPAPNYRHYRWSGFNTEKLLFFSSFFFSILFQYVFQFFYSSIPKKKE